MEDLTFEQIFMDFQDFLAPRLDVYEQAIYLYVLRHSRFIGSDEVVIGLKSARKRMALGMGTAGSPMSEGSAYLKLRSLSEKGYVQILGTTHKGQRLKLNLPTEIPGVVPLKVAGSTPDLEDMDFFEVESNRKLLLERENHKCFYTLKHLVTDNFVVDHVISRPKGDNSYKNCVASSREANNRKGAIHADDFLRRLFREGWLNENEFGDRMNHLSRLQAGELKPMIAIPIGK